MLRGHAGEPEHVLVLATLGAAQRARLRRRRPREAPESPPPAPVTTSRATLIASRPFPDAAAGERWLAAVDGEAEATRALAVLDRVLHLHRTATADPSARGVGRALALVVRVGIGVGEQVAEGRWTRAVELPPPPDAAPGRRPSAALRPDERLAALVAGRDAPLACEELALRARADLDAGRRREAALQLRVALDAALAELEPWAGRSELTARLAALREHRAPVAAAAEAALRGGLDDARTADVERALQTVESALRARTALGFDA